MNCAFIGVNQDTLLIQHQHIHGQPFGGHPQWMICRKVWVFSVKKANQQNNFFKNSNQALAEVHTIRNQRCRWFHNSPAGFLEHVNLSCRFFKKEAHSNGHRNLSWTVYFHIHKRAAEYSLWKYLATWAIWVRQHQSGADDVKSGINVHGIGILEWDDVHLVIWGQMAPHPLDTHVICNLHWGSMQRKSLMTYPNHAFSSDSLWIESVLLGMRAMLCTWLLWTKRSLPARMKSAASKQGSCSVVTNFPWAASLCLSSTVRMG